MLPSIWLGYASVAAGGAVFNDVHLNGVDLKGRVSLPAAFRQTIDIRSGSAKVASGLGRTLRMTFNAALKCIEVSDGLQIAETEEQMNAHAVRVSEQTGELIPVDVKAGDTVVYSKYGGTEITVDGEDVLILNARDVLAVIK